MKRSARTGFTLIELLIAVSLFSIAVAIAAGGFVRALRTQRQLIALISANSSASLAIEQMAREIRTGTDFSCIGAGGTCETLTFTNAAGDTIDYLSDSGVLQRRTNGAVPLPLTPTDTRVRDLSFLLFGGPNPPANFPPRITITMSVTANSYGLEENMTNLQTTVSARAF